MVTAAGRRWMGEFKPVDMMNKIEPQSSRMPHVSSVDPKLKRTDYRGGVGMDAGSRNNSLEITEQASPKSKFLVGLDVLCLIFVSIPFFASQLKLVAPSRRGFVCGDPSIAYPYLRTEAVPDELLIAGGFIIPGLTITLMECFRVYFQGVRSKAFVRNPYVSCLYKELGSFLFGCVLSQSLTNLAKLTMGQLRPHFLSVCGVTYESLNCKAGAYVASVTCTAESDRRLQEEARKSFFSGHASFAMFTMLYLVFYLQARLTWRGARLLRPALQFCLFLLAIYVGLTRISENRHHLTDVLIGYIQGGFTAYWVAFYISSMFKTISSDLSLAQTLNIPLTIQHSA